VTLLRFLAMTNHLLVFEVVCVGSVAELEKLSGVAGVVDLHRDKIDHITIPSARGKGRLRRVEEVFDCWFESGR
jgi:isoleucyl-tRNA synthetase